MRRLAVLALLRGLVAPAMAAQGAAARGGQGPVRTADDDVELLERAGEARTVGPDSARILLIEFLDYQCSVCAAFHRERGDSLKRALTPDVRLVYANFPLSSHLRSLHSAEAAMCAAGVGGTAAYAAMADRLLRGQGEWGEAFDASSVFARYAREIGLNAAAFADCQARDVPAALILSDLNMAARFAIAGTPTFVVLRTDARSPDEALRIAGNAPLKDILDLVAKARAQTR